MDKDVDDLNQVIQEASLQPQIPFYVASSSQMKENVPSALEPEPVTIHDSQRRCISFLHEVVCAYHDDQHQMVDAVTDLGNDQDLPHALNKGLGCLLLGQYDDVMPIRFVFRHCPTELDAERISKAWLQTLAEEHCLRAVYSQELHEQVSQVLWLNAQGWPLFNLEQREANWQTLTAMTALLRLPSDQIQTLNTRKSTIDQRELIEGCQPLLNNLPCRLLVVTGSEEVSGILLITQQMVCDAQTLQYVLVRFWRRLQGLTCKMPPWRPSLAGPHAAQDSLNYWRSVLVGGRFSLLPRDVSSVQTGDPLLNMQATFISQEQWRLLQQAAAVLEVDLETIMLSAFARWLMLTTQSDAALFSVIASRHSPLPVCPPELKPFSVEAGNNVGASEWVKLVDQQLQRLRQIPMAHLENLAHTLHQNQSTLAHMLLECVFCFEQIGVKWPEALAPSDRFGNASGQLGVYSMLQLSIDITDERMRLTWWGLAQLISKQQLHTYEKGYRSVLFELLAAVLQSEQWTPFDSELKQVVALTLQSQELPSTSEQGKTSASSSPLTLAPSSQHVLRILQKLVSDSPDACVVCTSKTQLTRLELWLSAALVAQEIFSHHPEFSHAQTHHGIVVMSNDPVMLAILCLAAQMCQLVPLVVSIDARRTLLADTQHKAWHKLGTHWLVTSRALPDGVPRLEKKVLVDARQLLTRVRRALNRCKALGIDFSISLSQQSIGAKALPAQEVSVLRAVSRFFTGPLFQAALGGRPEDPVLGYFDPIAISLPEETIVSNSRYWFSQSQWVGQQENICSGRGAVMIVGQQLDHAGFWPFYSSLIAGLPVLWVLPDLLLDTPNAGPLPEIVSHFLFSSNKPLAQGAQSKQPATICFMSELSFALLATEEGHRNRVKQLQQGARVIVLGEGRLNLPESYSAIDFPEMLLMVAEYKGAQVAGNHAGDPYNSAARMPLGLIEPVDRSQSNAIHDNIILKSVLPMHRVFALGTGLETLAYARSSLRVEVDGLWSASSVHRPSGSILSIPNRGVSEAVLRLRWDTASSVIVRDRGEPVIEPDDLWFQPHGAWSASCRFWERLVQRYCQSCWTRVRPENITTGICGARIIPLARYGTVEQNNENIRRFTDSVNWMRLFTAVGRHWGSGVMPRWIEIFGSQFEPFVERSLSETMTFTRLAQWSLRLRNPPRVSQTWAELGGDWFAFFRFSFVLRRLGWEWAVPIRSLHQPLGKLALCVRRAEDISSVLDLPSDQPSAASAVQDDETSLTRYSMPLSGYQLGMFRRHSDNLPNQMHRLQFYYSGSMRLVELRASLNRWIALFPALTSYFELTGQGMQQRFLMSHADRLSAKYLHDVISERQSDYTTHSKDDLIQGQLPRWDDLVDRALRFQHEPFDSAFAEKFAIEEHTRQMQLQSPPLWRCLVFPKGQGRWSVWLLMNKLLLDQREWLDSVRCLELLLFKTPATQRTMFWLDSKHWPQHFYSKTISQIAHNRQKVCLAQSTQESIARFWRERLQSTAATEVPMILPASDAEPQVKTVIQPLPQGFSGEAWRGISSQTGVDRLTVFTWAVLSMLTRFSGVSAHRIDLETPWAPLASFSDDMLTAQNGVKPVFAHLPDAAPLQQLVVLKQQLYECLLMPNPEALLVPGDMRFEALYDALYQQYVCFSYLERLPENRELSAMSDVEQIRTYRSRELLSASNRYQLKIEAFPSRGQYVFAWSFDENLLPSQSIERFVHAVDTTLQEMLEQLQRLAFSGLALHSVRRTGASQLRCWTQSALLCPADFGFIGLSEEDWNQFKQKTPVYRSLWMLGGISHWVLERSLKNPRCLVHGSQVVICSKRPAIEVSRRLQNLSLLVPELTARWFVFENGTVGLVCTSQSPVLHKMSTEKHWDPKEAFINASDRFGFNLPCMFTIHEYSDTQMLVRCDYDLRAIEPAVINAALKALSEGHMRPLKYAIRQRWVTKVSENLAIERALPHKSELESSKTLPLTNFSHYAEQRKNHWTKTLSELIGKPQSSSWLPLTRAFDPQEQANQQVRSTVIDAVAHSAKPVQIGARLHGLICAIQTIRHYVVRLWGTHPWVIHLIFANQSVVSKLGLDEYWSDEHLAEPQCWLPLLMGSNQDQDNDATKLFEQLKRSGQYPVSEEAQLLQWLGWPQEVNLSDIVLIITDESPDSSIAQDWHHFQAAPLQFQWDCQLPTRIRLSAHPGLAILPEPQTQPINRPIQVLEAQARTYDGVENIAARSFVLSEVFPELDLMGNELNQQLIVLDVALKEVPEDKIRYAHQLQSYLAKRLGSWLLPDFVRICPDPDSWGAEACIQWLRTIDEKHQRELEERLTPVLLRADQQLFGLAHSGKILTRGYRWFDRVGDRLPGWPAERARHLLKAQHDEPQEKISLRAVRNLRQWTQWSDSGKYVAPKFVGPHKNSWALTPDQACWLVMESESAHFFNAGLLLKVASDQTSDFILEQLKALVIAEPIFRLHFKEEKASFARVSEKRYASLVQSFSTLDDAAIISAVIKNIDFSNLNIEQMLESITRVAKHWQSHFDLFQAPLVRFIYFSGPAGEKSDHLLVLGHRFAIDHRGLYQLVARLDAKIQGRVVSVSRSWRDWVSFLAHQCQMLQQMPAASMASMDITQHINDLDNKLYQRMSEVLGLPKSALMRSYFKNTSVRRQFLPPIEDHRALLFSEGKVGVQDPRTVLGMAALSLAIGSWLNLDSVVVGQWWPVREDPRARQWTDVVGSFEFLFKNAVHLSEGSALSTARRLFAEVPETLQATITQVLSRDHFDEQAAFSLFTFERIDGQLHVPRFDHFSPLPYPVGNSVEPENRRRSLIRVEAVFTQGQFSLMWIYDNKVMSLSTIERLVTHFAYFWQMLCKELGELEGAHAAGLSTPGPATHGLATQSAENDQSSCLKLEAQASDITQLAKAKTQIAPHEQAPSVPFQEAQYTTETEDVLYPNAVSTLESADKSQPKRSTNPVPLTIQPNRPFRAEDSPLGFSGTSSIDHQKVDEEETL